MITCSKNWIRSKRKNELRIKVKEGYQTNLMPFSLTGNYILKRREESMYDGDKAVTYDGTVSERR